MPWGENGERCVGGAGMPRWHDQQTVTSGLPGKRQQLQILRVVVRPREWRKGGAGL